LAHNESLKPEDQAVVSAASALGAETRAAAAANPSAIVDLTLMRWAPPLL
jgi:hypothetical protein